LLVAARSARVLLSAGPARLLVAAHRLAPSPAFVTIAAAVVPILGAFVSTVLVTALAVAAPVLTAPLSPLRAASTSAAAASVGRSIVLPERVAIGKALAAFVALGPVAFVHGMRQATESHNDRKNLKSSMFCG
jgi:hypothetical protein